MSIPIARPEHTLRQAFEELDRAAQEAADQSHAVTVAQGRVDAAQALQAAAQVQLKNAEARHSVLAKSLELAAPDLEALQARYAERESELTLVREQLLIVGAQEETVAQAQAALRDLFDSLRGIRADAVLALEAMRGS